MAKDSKDAKKAGRIAVVDRELCKPKKCGLACRVACPIVRGGEECIAYVTDAGGKRRLAVDESLCIGCGICVKRCPFGALSVVNLPSELKESPVHRFGPNEFALYRLPFPSTKDIVGIVGPNGVGKTTALRILSGEIKPNFSNFDTENPSASDMFRGTELQAYMESLADKKLKTSIKPQRVDQIPVIFKGNITKLLDTADERKIANEMIKEFGLEGILDREVSKLSGGELQRVAIVAALARDADIYYLDEPTSFLDVFQRLRIAKLIRKYCEGRSVMIVDHDLATLDFLADRVHIFFGVPGVYGIVSKPYGVRVGINTFLDGYIKEDNVRFRDYAINFLNDRTIGKQVSQKIIVSFSDVRKKFEGKGGFGLEVKDGSLHEKEVLAVLGANALGKTTFAKILAGELEADAGSVSAEVRISYKPQYIKTEFAGSVQELLRKSASLTDTFKAEIARPLGLEKLFDKDVSNLSGGEIQRVAIAICLAKDADLYLLDEPSAFLDVEQRLATAKLINRIAEASEKAALVIDHDLLFLSQVGHRGMVFEGEPGVAGSVERVDGLKDALNKFLAQVGVTFRKDPQTGRPRANKFGSQLDREQKEANSYFM
ncbi:MAG: ribosome biogenesis/translation initiation ATPase RLI [Candidatus Aenigmatarchaeota archaeon]